MIYRYLSSKNLATRSEQERTRTYKKKQKKQRPQNNVLGRTSAYTSECQISPTFSRTLAYAGPIRYSVTTDEAFRRVAERVTGQDLPSLKHLFEQRVLSKIDKIMADESHPLNEHYTFNRSGIRLRVPVILSQIPAIYSITLPEGITILSFILL